MPDTLDLAERARLAIHGMTEPTDPQADYEVYWHVLFRCHPPMMRHEWPCISMRPKFEETVSLMRMMCGSDQNLDVEAEAWRVFLGQIHDDGLLYCPIGGDGPPPNTSYPALNGVLAQALVLRVELDGREPWSEPLHSL